MSEYLATGTTPGGKKVTERVEADSADEAVQLLRERGFDDVVLHTDDFGAHYGKQAEVDAVISPREYLWLRNLPRPLSGFLLVTIKTYQRGKFSSLLILGLLGYRRYVGLGWGLFDTALALAFFLPVIWAFVAQFFGGAAAAYDRFIEAVSWGRWREVLERAETLQGVPPEEVATRKAQALASLGRFDEAIAEVEPFGDGEAIPIWLYHSRLAEVYSVVHRHHEAIALTEQALEEAPDNATILIDLARMEILHRRDPLRARTYLDRAREHALSDVLQPFATSVEGLIRLEEGDARAARSLLEEAYQGVEKFRHASPLVGAMLDQMHATLCWARAAEGDIDAARKHYRLARPRMVALGKTDEIKRCEEALGTHLDG